MTQGIVSALNRQAGIIAGEFAYEDFVQVDAAINPGNSGGPLVNQRGEVVGINTAIASRSGGFQGIGFSIPSNQAKPVYEQIRKRGRVIRGWLGVEIMDVRRLPEEQLKSLKFDGTDGVFVRTVQRGTPAFGALQAGDIVTEFDGKPLRDTRQLRNMVAATAPGTEISLRVVRDGESKLVKVKVGEQPDEPGRVASTPDPADATASAEKLGLRLGTPNARQLEAVGLDPNDGGALVRSVAPDSLAAQAGIVPGDIITSIGGKKISDANDAAEALAGADITKGVRLTVSSRDGDRMVFLQRR
jgi:serine protease Do